MEKILQLLSKPGFEPVRMMLKPGENIVCRRCGKPMYGETFMAENVSGFEPICEECLASSDRVLIGEQSRSIAS